MLEQRAYTGQSDFSSSLSDVGRMRFLVQQMMTGVATATLVQVRAVDGDTVDVQPMIAQIDGAGNALLHGTIHGLPFLKLRAGGSVIDLTPKVDDIGLAIFCHNDISAVKKTKKPAAPGSRRRFDWADGVFIGGLLGARRHSSSGSMTMASRSRQRRGRPSGSSRPSRCSSKVRQTPIPNIGWTG